MITKYDYDLIKFGKLSEDIRLRNKLKKTTIQKKYNINPDTLRKLELGITSPTHETLLKLTEAFNMDMIKIFESCKYSNHYTLNIIRQKINKASYENRTEELTKIIQEIKASGHFNPLSDRVNNEIKQLEYLIEIVKLKNKTDKLNVENMEILSLKAIRLTKPHFNIKHLNNTVYSLIESRFLLSFALSQIRKLNYTLAGSVIDFVIENLSFQLRYDDSVATLLVQAYYQKSNNLFQLNRNVEVIECCKYALLLALKYSCTQLIPYIYFRQGIAEHDLCLHESIETLRKSLSYLESHGLQDLKQTFVESLINNYNIVM